MTEWRIIRTDRPQPKSRRGRRGEESRHPLSQFVPLIFFELRSRMHCTEDKVSVACCTGTSIQDIQRLKSKASLRRMSKFHPFPQLKDGRGCRGPGMAYLLSFSFPSCVSLFPLSSPFPFFNVSSLKGFLPPPLLPLPEDGQSRQDIAAEGL